MLIVAAALHLTLVHFIIALELDPDMIPACDSLGELNKAQGEEAQDVLMRFIELSEDPQKIAKAHALLAGLAGQPFIMCAQCGSFTTLGILYKKTKKGTLCPRCYVAFQIKKSRDLLWIVGLVVIVYGALALLIPQAMYMVINGLLFLLSNYLMIVPHELAHAGMAWLLKGKVFEIRIGLGPVLWEKALADVLISVRKYPIAGFCALGFPTSKAIQARVFLAAAAGLLFSASMMLLFVHGFDRTRLTTAYAFREIFVAVNGFQVLVNSIPRKVSLGQVQASTDSGQLLRILTGKQPAESNHLSYFLLGSRYAWKREAYAHASALCEAGLALYPHSSLLKNMQAVIYLEQGKYAAALALFKALLAPFQLGDTIDEPGVTDENREMVKAMLLNNVAFATIMSDPDPEALQEAYACAQQAYLMLPWHASIEGTWGAVLVEVGRVNLGLKYLSANCEHEVSESDKASTIAYMALGHQRLGDSEKAAALLKQALALDATHHVVQKIQAALQRTS